MSAVNDLFCVFKFFRKMRTLKNNYRLRVKDLEEHLLKYNDRTPSCPPSCNFVFGQDTQSQVVRWMEEDMKEEGM